MVHKELLTEEEAAHLAEKLPVTTHPQHFKDAHRIIEKLLADVRK